MDAGLAGMISAISPIKSIQRGTAVLQTPGTGSGINSGVTISSVDLSKAFCKMTYYVSDNAAASGLSTYVRISLSSATNLSLVGICTLSSVVYFTIDWEVIEYR